LRVHHCDHRRTLAELSGELGWAFANVIVDAINASPAILTHVVCAIVNVVRAVGTAESGRAFACVVRKVIDALGAIRARIEFGTAELNLFLAELTSEARQATASVRLDTIHTSSIVLALVLLAVVNIHFAS